jgi:hypothetical protein
MDFCDGIKQSNIVILKVQHRQHRTGSFCERSDTLTKVFDGDVMIIFVALAAPKVTIAMNIRSDPFAHHALMHRRSCVVLYCEA